MFHSLHITPSKLTGYFDTRYVPVSKLFWIQIQVKLVKVKGTSLHMTDNWQELPHDDCLRLTTHSYASVPSAQQTELKAEALKRKNEAKKLKLTGGDGGGLYADSRPPRHRCPCRSRAAWRERPRMHTRHLQIGKRNIWQVSNWQLKMTIERMREWGRTLDRQT